MTGQPQKRWNSSRLGFGRPDTSASVRKWSEKRLSALAPKSFLPEHPLGYAIIVTIGVGIGLAVLSAIASLATVLVYIGLALFLALAIEPVLQVVTRRGAPRWAATSVFGLVFVGGIVGFIFALIPSLVEQITALSTHIVSFFTELPNQEWFVWLSNTLGNSLSQSALISQISGFFSDPNQLFSVAGGILKVGTGIMDGVTGVIVVSILTIYFTLSLPSVKAKGYLLVPASRRNRIEELTEEILQSVGRYVGGQVLLAVINSAFTFTLVSILGSPAPAFLALIAFIGALIPVVGTVIGSTIVVLVMLTTSPGAALISAIVLLVYMQVEAYILSPRVMARAVAVPGALVIISAIAGATLGGILGALVAVPVTAAVLIIVDKVVIPHQARN